MALACRKVLYRTIFLDDDILNAFYESYLSMIQPYSKGPQLDITDYKRRTEKSLVFYKRNQCYGAETGTYGTVTFA